MHLLPGYDILKGSFVIGLSYALHTEEKNWHNANQFDPSRWLDDEGKFLKRENFMPFGIGPRYLDIMDLKIKHAINDAIFSGVVSVRPWRNLSCLYLCARYCRAFLFRRKLTTPNLTLMEN